MVAPRTEIRETITDSLSSFLQETISGTVKEDHIFNYGETFFGGASPVITVSSSGTGPVPLSTKGLNISYVYTIMIFVEKPKEEEQDKGTWDNKKTEIQLDDLSKAVVDWYDQSRTEQNQFQGLTIPQDSTIVPISVSGKGYLVEAYQVRLQEPF